VADGTLIPQIQKSHSLHDISNVWVIDHADCGGFGGLAEYEDDETKEAQAHFESLTRAKQAIHKVLPRLVVTTFLIDLDGEKTLLPASTSQTSG
jgi:carbonic anhydrase